MEWTWEFVGKFRSPEYESLIANNARLCQLSERDCVNLFGVDYERTDCLFNEHIMQRQVVSLPICGQYFDWILKYMYTKNVDKWIQNQLSYVQVST